MQVFITYYSQSQRVFPFWDYVGSDLSRVGGVRLVGLVACGIG